MEKRATLPTPPHTQVYAALPSPAAPAGSRLLQLCSPPFFLRICACASGSPCVGGCPASIPLPTWARMCLDLGSVILPCFFQSKVDIPGGVKTHLLAFIGAVTSFFKQLEIFQDPHDPFGCQATSLFWRAGLYFLETVPNLHAFPHLFTHSFLTPDNLLLPAGLFPKQLRERCSAIHFDPLCFSKI